MKKVLLINPQESYPDWPTMPRAIEPMGLMYVSGVFKSLSVEVAIIDYQLEFGDIDKIHQDIAMGDYIAAGIALVSQSSLWNAFSNILNLKKLCPSLIIFTGGVFATLNAEWIIKNNPAIDFVILGESESTICEWVCRDFRWENLGNIVSRNIYKKLRVSTSYFSENHYKPDRRLAQTVIAKGENPSIVATRGCGGRCTFCCVSACYNGNWRTRNCIEVFDEINELSEKYHINRFYFTDDNLFGHTSVSKNWIKDFANCILNAKKEFKFKTTCRLDNIDESIIDDIRNAGFNLLKIGIETLSAQAQKLYNKKISRENIISKLDLLKKNGIDVSLGMIMFNPYSTPEDIKENFEFMKIFPESWSRHLLRTRLNVYRRTAIEQILQRRSLTYNSSIFGSDWHFINPGAEKIYNIYNFLLKKYILRIEWKIYNKQKSYIRSGMNAPKLEVTDLLKQCWMNLFELALNEKSSIPDKLKKELLLLNNEVDNYGVD